MVDQLFPELSAEAGWCPSSRVRAADHRHERSALQTSGIKHPAVLVLRASSVVLRIQASVGLGSIQDKDHSCRQGRAIVGPFHSVLSTTPCLSFFHFFLIPRIIVICS